MLVVELRGGTVASDGRVLVAKALLGVAELGMCLRHVGFEFDGLLQGLGGGLEVALPLVGEGQVVVERVILRLEFDGFAESGDCFIGLVQPQVGAGEVGLVLSDFRRQLDRPFELREGEFVLALFVIDEPEVVVGRIKPAS